MQRINLEKPGKWEVVDTKGTPPAPRSGHSANVIDGEIWIYGNHMHACLPSIPFIPLWRSPLVV